MCGLVLSTKVHYGYIYMENNKLYYKRKTKHSTYYNKYVDGELVEDVNSKWRLRQYWHYNYKIRLEDQLELEGHYLTPITEKFYLKIRALSNESL
jgi:hypothetical protein